VGPENLASDVAYHASQMYGKNIQTLLELILQDGNINLDFDDEIVAGTVVAHDGEVPHPYMRKLLDLPALDVEAQSK
jgi:NAD(P) transhydrogenase subunit alpha